MVEKKGKSESLAGWLERVAVLEMKEEGCFLWLARLESSLMPPLREAFQANFVNEILMVSK